MNKSMLLFGIEQPRLPKKTNQPTLPTALDQPPLPTVTEIAPPPMRANLQDPGPMLGHSFKSPNPPGPLVASFQDPVPLFAYVGPDDPRNQEVPPGMSEVGPGYVNHPICEQVPIGYEPLKAEQQPTRIEPNRANIVPPQPVAA